MGRSVGTSGWGREGLRVCLLFVLGTVNAFAVDDVPGERFQEMGDNIVYDSQTGLMWASRGNGKDIDWYEAETYCNKFAAGGYDDWLFQRPQNEFEKKIRPDSGKTVKKKAASAPKKKKLGYMEKRELAALPQQIEAMEKEQADLFEKMSAPDFYKTDGKIITQIKARQQDLETLLEDAYARWEDLESRDV